MQNADIRTPALESTASNARESGAPRLDARTAREWLRQEVEVRVPRLWLVAGAAVVAALGLVALD
ncbi:hypothetical protein [Salinarimonas ramus]|uniref:Uncharacterized protein n=1 Tax=Salinarimonas ramus TaxID=690164 RepID=A0A917V3L5_9HYPH|nr:hypothetical protein [Salinarimonas ramus]GGK32674.1 hypothetical protein GCM10011322_19200 [Salinarimonas ramus]